MKILFCFLLAFVSIISKAQDFSKSFATYTPSSYIENTSPSPSPANWPIITPYVPNNPTPEAIAPAAKQKWSTTAHYMEDRKLKVAIIRGEGDIITSYKWAGSHVYEPCWVHCHRCMDEPYSDYFSHETCISGVRMYFNKTDAD